MESNQQKAMAAARARVADKNTVDSTTASSQQSHLVVANTIGTASSKLLSILKGDKAEEELAAVELWNSYDEVPDE